MPQFNPDAVGRIRRTVKAAEARPGSKAIPDRRIGKTASGRAALGGRLCVTTSLVTARSGTSPAFTMGSGTALMLTLNGLVTSSTGESETVLNSVNATIAVGRLCQVKVIEGQLFVDVVDCP